MWTWRSGCGGGLSCSRRDPPHNHTVSWGGLTTDTCAAPTPGRPSWGPHSHSLTRPATRQDRRLDWGLQATCMPPPPSPRRSQVFIEHLLGASLGALGAGGECRALNLKLTWRAHGSWGSEASRPLAPGPMGPSLPRYSHPSPAGPHCLPTLGRRRPKASSPPGAPSVLPSPQQLQPLRPSPGALAPPPGAAGGCLWDGVWDKRVAQGPFPGPGWHQEDTVPGERGGAPPPDLPSRGGQFAPFL